MSRKKKIIVLIVILLMVFLVLVGIQAANSNTTQSLTKVTKQDITEVVTETGIVETTSITSLYSPSTGIVTNVFAKNGDTVQKGETLFAIESTATEKEKSEALSTYLSAKALFDAAETKMFSLQAVMFTNWDTYKQLAENDTYETAEGKPREENRTLPEFIVSQREWLAAEKSYKDQQTVVSQTQAALAGATRTYEATKNATVKATIDGVLANVSVTKGSSMVANNTKPLAIITTNAPSEVQVLLGESDIAKVSVGQEATVELKAIQGLTLAGKVSRIDSIGSETKGVIRYTAYIELEKTDSRLRSGMKTDVTIITQKKLSVLAVPNSAVKPYKGSKAVRVLGKGQKIEYVPVTVGIRGDTYTEIQSGLTDNQSIILSLPNDQIKRTGPFGF